MLSIDVEGPPAATDHHIALWEREECYRYYVKLRRKHCTPTQFLDVWLHAPYCEECAQCEATWWLPSTADIHPATWAFDIAWSVNPACLRRTTNYRRKDRRYGWRCKGCSRSLKPWRDDSVYVASYHLEEHYGIDLATPGRVNPSKRLREQIVRIYGSRCFACRKKRELHLDHVRPRSKGGDAAFRNLQPLCESCGQSKGNADAEEIRVDDDLYFRPCPSDAYEGLFW